MTVLSGSLHSEQPLNYAGYRVTAEYDRLLDPEGEVLIPVAQSTTAVADGDWALTLEAEPQGAVTLTARTPTGVLVGAVTTTELTEPIVIELVDAPTPVVIPPVDDPSYGRPLTLSGRVLQPDGSGVPDGFPVVLWAAPEQGTPLPVLVAGTTEGGYFSGDWTSARYAQAWGTVAGGPQIPVRLEDGRLPRVVLLVVPETLTTPEHDDHEDDDCDCHAPAPPRAPDQTELVANPAAFSEDLGAGSCVSVTMPNRTVEEVVFHAVVRTTQPEIKGTTVPDSPALPPAVANRLSALSRTGMLRLTGDDQEEVHAIARGNPHPVHLDAAVVGAELRERALEAAPMPAELARMQRLTAVKRLRETVQLLNAPAPGRVTLDAEHRVDWDEDPTIYQATSVAVGHLLTLKQVWRADGYSLGDLLYSLPLAPGQKKQVAIVDWERRETTLRESRRETSEQLVADLAHDRDISDIMRSALAEHSRGSSSASVSAVGGGIGAFIGPIVLGGGGGHSSSESTAHAHSWRDVSATMLNQARDRVQQAASVVRGQRATTVQTTTQGESLRAQTEVVANHNHCHALSMEYFEVLRHFQVSTELAGARECLFVPFEISPFTPAKVLRWWEPLARHLRRTDLRGGFDALERARTGWAYADMPVARYADERINYLDGDLTMTFTLPRPADDEDDKFVAANWAPWAALLGPAPVADVWKNYLGSALPAQRDQIWNERLAPVAAARLAGSLELRLRLDDDSTVLVPLDPTMVSRFRQDVTLDVSLQPELATATEPRARLKAVRISLREPVPFTAKVVVRTASLHYRTDHLSHPLFAGYRVDKELSTGSVAEIGVHNLDRTERRDPRKEDVLLGARLVAHLNERLEFYHQAIWLSMHANRRYLLLDGVIAPFSGGRSVASVVENSLIGIVGNCLVFPVVPGMRLDWGYETDPERPATLLDLYAVDSPRPVRMSVPTKGVFAEAVLGACNSCEKKDDTRFWRWEESPIPDSTPQIAAVGTGTRRGTPPDLAPDAFPDAIVRFQQIPDSPDPTGLGAALKLIGTPNLFRDLTGLDLTQQSAAAAFSKALETAQFFGNQAGNLAQQRFANREMDRNLERVKQAKQDGLITSDQARTLTEQMLRGGTGKGTSTKPAPSATPAVRKAIDRAAASESGTVHVSRTAGAVDITTGAGGPVDFDVDPPVTPLRQPSDNTCWAAGGAMMLSWRRRVSYTVASAADAAGSGWRTKLDTDKALVASELRAYAQAIEMTGESPMCYLPRGLLRLLRTHGPLWVIGDDAIEGNKMAHVRVVTGMHGDGTADGTDVHFVDPADGATHQETFTEFSRHLEATDPASLNLGIYHY